MNASCTVVMLSCKRDKKNAKYYKLKVLKTASVVVPDTLTVSRTIMTHTYMDTEDENITSRFCHS